jgi:hypothetical protein
MASSSRVGKGDEMNAGTVPNALSERLGVEATTGLVDLIGIVERDMTEAVIVRSVERFERRLVEEVSQLRVEMREGDAALRLEVRDVRHELAAFGSGLRQEMATLKFDMLKWSFLFWVGQVAAIVALLRLAGR